LVFFITFLVYSPLLFNQYVGDDHYIIEKNTFYSSWKNVPRLFEKGYITDAGAINLNSEARFDFGTGSVSYRPASNFTYFFDYFLFQGRPYGSHLIDILIHGVNAVLVYWIVAQIFSSPVLGVFAALLFSLHPMQSEAVAVMSYRADICAAMFALFSFVFWMKFKQGGYAHQGYYGACLAMCLLAMFSKESAFVLPLVILLFDQILPVPMQGGPRWVYYAGFAPILAFYLYLYFVVFPNATLSFHWLGGSFVNHCLLMVYIWHYYLINAIFPWTVKLIPGLYCPPVPGVFSLVTFEMGAALIILVAGIGALWSHYKECVFFLLWYIIFYLPVSNLLPIVNPMAGRFMYLPSIGLLVVLAFFLHRIFSSNFISKHSRYLPGILYAGVMMVCITRTLFLNGDWKSDFDVGYAWVSDYASDSRGYALLGLEYYKAGHFEKARGYLEKSVLLGDRIPLTVMTLSGCYMQLGKWKEAESLLKQIILHYPDYADAFLFLGEAYYLEKDNQQARPMLEKTLMLDPRKAMAYKFLMRVYLNLHQFEAAKILLKKAAFYLNTQDVSQLHHILEQSKQVM